MRTWSYICDRPIKGIKERLKSRLPRPLSTGFCSHPGMISLRVDVSTAVAIPCRVRTNLNNNTTQNLECILNLEQQCGYGF